MIELTSVKYRLIEGKYEALVFRFDTDRGPIDVGLDFKLQTASGQLDYDLLGSAAAQAKMIYESDVADRV